MAIRSESDIKQALAELENKVLTIQNSPSHIRIAKEKCKLLKWVLMEE